MRKESSIRWPQLGVLEIFIYSLLFAIVASHGLNGGVDGQVQLPPPQKIDIVHVTTVTIKQDLSTLSVRRRQEKLRLLRRIHKSKAFRGSSHPRDRLLTALYAFSKYGEAATAEIQRFKDLYSHTPKEHKDLLKAAINHEDTFGVARSLIQKNALICEAMVANALEYYQVSRQEHDAFTRQMEKKREKPDRMAVSQAIKLFVRDWSVQGGYERKDTIPCLLDSMQQYLPDVENSLDEDQSIKVLVPGAGLNRLAHEISMLSPRVAVTSNEWSSFVNIAYRYFEKLNTSNQIMIYPYLESWSHLRTRSEAERGIPIPDVVFDPSNVLLVEGDFTRVFDNHSHVGTYDFIVTLFFIDTARNLLAYFEMIHKLLKPGGLWINQGPLLYGSAPFMQLSLDEIVAVVKEMGFQFERPHAGCGVSSLPGELVVGKEVLYNFNGSALNKFAYEAQTWVARKI